jgi:hypothetical protein
MSRILRTRSLIFAAIAAAAICSIFWSGSAEASCLEGNEQLAPQKIADFTANPSQALTQNPEGGAALISQIRDLAASDPATLSVIMGLLPNANRDQKRAIGSALAQAARICVRSDQAYAGKIQQAVADAKDPDLRVAYAAAAGDQPIGAAGGAGAGSAGGVGGATGVTTGTGGGGGPAEGINGNGVNTGSFGFTSSVSGASSNPVSP